MHNKISNFFNRGIINQTIIVDPKIDPILTILKKDFYSGKITSAFETLQQLITEYNDIEKIVFQLLKVKAHFLLALYKINDYIILFKHLEKNYNYSDSDYKQLKLFYFLIKQDKNNYFTSANELSILTGQQKEFYELQYYVNTNPDKAIEIYEKYFKDDITPELLFLGAFAYLKKCSSFNILDQNSDYYIHLELYKRCIEKIESDNKIERLNYLTNASNVSIHFKLDQISEDKCPIEISLTDDFIEIVDNFGVNIKNFEKDFIQHVINQYLMALSLKDNKSKYIEIASQYTSILSSTHFLQYHYYQGDLSDELVLERFRITSDYFLIELYLRSLYENDKKNTIEFVIKNSIYNSGQLLSYKFFFLALIDNNDELPAEYYHKIYNQKDDSVKHLLLYLTICLALKNEIDHIDIQRLFKLSNDINTSYNYLFESIEIFSKTGHWDKVFQLSLIKKEIYPQIVEVTLKFCLDLNTTLSMYDFESYINSISDKKGDCSYFIGLVYHNFQIFKKAYEFYNICWSKKRSAELAANLFSVLIALKKMTGLKSDEEKTLEDSLAFLEADESFDNFKITLQIAYYYIENNDYIKGFKLFNGAVLKRELDGYSQNEIDDIASFFNFQPNDYRYSEDKFNIYINSEDKNFIYDGYTLSNSVKKNFNFELADDLKLKILRIEVLKKSQDPIDLNNKILCLSSVLIFYFLRQSSHVTSFAIDESFIDDPLSFLDSILKPYAAQREESLKKLSDYKISPFYQIESNFLKFPDLIRILKERSDIIFFSGYNMPQKKFPKLLTITSIFFLDSIGLFTDFISEQLDIYIQKSVFKFFFECFEKNDEFGNIFQILKNLNEAKRIIDDSMSGPLCTSIIKLRESFGIFDYNAICIGLSNKVQLISEDPSLLKFFGNIEGFVLPTNSVFLIYRNLAGKDDSDTQISKIMTELHSSKYKYILPFEIIEQVRFFSKNKDLIMLESVRSMINIAEDYDWLRDDDLIDAMSTD